MNKSPETSQKNIAENAGRLLTLFNRYEKEFGRGATLGRAMAGMLTDFLMCAEPEESQSANGNETAATTAPTFDNSFRDKSARHENSKHRAAEIMQKSAELIGQMDQIAAEMGLKVLLDIQKQKAFGPGEDLNVSSAEINLEVVDPKKFEAAIRELHQNAIDNRPAAPTEKLNAAPAPEIAATSGNPANLTASPAAREILNKVIGPFYLPGASINLTGVAGLGALSDLAETYFTGSEHLIIMFKNLSKTDLDDAAKKKIISRIFEGESIARSFNIISSGDAAKDFIEKTLSKMEKYIQSLLQEFNSLPGMVNYVDALRSHQETCLHSYISKVELWREQGDALDKAFTDALELVKNHLGLTVIPPSSLN